MGLENEEPKEKIPCQGSCQCPYCNRIFTFTVQAISSDAETIEFAMRCAVETAKFRLETHLSG